MHFNQNQDYFAGCMSNEDFILIETYSGLGLVKKDYMFPAAIFELDVDNEKLGISILQALNQSRTIHNATERAEFFNLEKSKQEYEEWVKMLRDKFQYKSKKALLNNMKICNIWLNNGQIEIKPTKHIKLEAWDGEGIKEEDHVYLSITDSPSEIGQGLKLALQRCI